MRLMKLRRWPAAIVSIVVALAALAMFVCLGYKIIGLAGAGGVIILLAGLAVHATMVKAEDDSIE
ncbi:MAG TPA: hypothetical protein VFH71_12360 [Rhodanobacteraceae bacterium]|nr:hypothetical protein [Rhodanobacteraceae bacterium]